MCSALAGATDDGGAGAVEHGRACNGDRIEFRVGVAESGCGAGRRREQPRPPRVGVFKMGWAGVGGGLLGLY